jgi:hypothetical protein
MRTKRLITVYKLAMCQLLLGSFWHPTTSYATCFSSPPFLFCVVLLGRGCLGSPVGGGGCMNVCAVWVPVPPALGHDLAWLFWDFRI